ncbi:hypothetical protein [Flavobacterium undicola]|uniref:hypothetical protein n=1 Tax=Flavobacterium undicola TaxID=1932779 RepID=UPI0013782FD7|nr:hypothetical protein [Flavobacterium undicola]MBA0884319.1 hypothetical protein [Flavobacterium undicola]
MKTFTTILLFLGLMLPCFSQEKEEGAIDIKELPSVVIKRVGADFSIYIPDKNPDMNVRKLQDAFIAYDIGKNTQGDEIYLVVFSTENNSLAATYNEKGKLMRVVENYTNVKLPRAVIYSIYKTYPDWSLVNDKFLYTQREGDVIKNQYNVKIQKGKKTMKLKVHPNGEIIK